MANTFNFNTKLGLDAQGFKQGVSKVKNSLNGLKSSFLSLASALGAGLGFTQLISNLKSTATELSVAMNTLKNVSYQTKVFGEGTKETRIELTNFHENLGFVKQLANDYAQDLVSVTENYAKFSAACKKTDLALEDQRFIFESLTKAAAYYHLSADRTSDMMNAVTQMMSKGKVTAEELRRQLGNTLPGAFNLFAAAMDKSTQELEEMMRAGKVIASKELPKFAAMLNTITKTADFDSLQSSMNKLKNTWYEFVEKSGSEKIFKFVIDGSAKALTVVSNNINGIKASMVGLATYFTTVNLFSMFQRQGQEWLNSLNRTVTVSEERMVSLKKRLESIQQKGDISKTDGGPFVATVGATITEKDAKTMVRYNNLLLDAKRAQVQLGVISKKEFKEIEMSIRQANGALTGMITTTNSATVSAGRMKTMWIGLGSALTKAGKALKTFFASNWVFLLISTIASAITYFIRIKNEAKEIAAISENYTNDIAKQEGTLDAEAAKLKNNLAILKDVNNSESARLIALNKINKALGLVGEDAYKLDELDKVKGAYDEITEKVYDWIEATKKQAIIQAHANVIADATAKKTDAERRERELINKLSAKNALNNNNWMGIGVANQRRQLKNVREEIREYNESIAASEKAMKDYGISLGEFFDEVMRLDGDGGNKEIKGLAKIMADYEKDTKELARQHKEGALSQKEYNEALNKIVQEAYKAAAATGEVSMEDILSKLDSKKKLTAIEQWYKELRELAIQGAHQILLDGIAESIVKDIDEALEEELKELEKEFEKILENDEKRRQVDIDYAGATSELKYQNSRNKRDGTFDYKKTKAEIFGEEANIANDNLERVMDKIQELLKKEKELMETTGQGLDAIAQQELKSLQDYYRQLSKEATNIEDAYRFEQIRQDIEDFENEMLSGIFSGIENFATSMDRVVSGAKQLRDLMENVDTTGWEKLMGVVNYIFNIINAITSVIETVNTLTEIGNSLAGARSLLDDKKKVDAALELEGTTAQIAAEETLASIKSQQAAAETTITTNKIAQAEASLGLATALGVETAAWVALAAAMKDAAMAAAAASAAAAAGPAAPAAALAAAAEVGAGLTATMAAFAKGGIVGGNSTRGDHNLARVNSGEMILNKAQQSTLFSMLNGKGGFGGNVNFKIKGTDLIGVINNENSRRRG